MKTTPASIGKQARKLTPKFRAHQDGGKRRSSWWILLLAVVCAVLLVVFGILPRIQARTALRQETDQMAVPTVAVVQPKRSAPAHEIILPASVQAFADAPIYARTNGYLKRWYVDIGTRVQAGQLLADIDTPEVNQQLRQARADLATVPGEPESLQDHGRSVRWPVERPIPFPNRNLTTRPGTTRPSRPYCSPHRPT